MTLQAATNPRARWALALGIAALVLIYPFGIVLGPLALLFGMSVVRRINRSGTLTGAGQARAGAILGGVVIALYLLAVLGELVAVLLFGSPIGAPA
jgi:hypothetical protein